MRPVSAEIIVVADAPYESADTGIYKELSANHDMYGNISEMDCRGGNRLSMDMTNKISFAYLTADEIYAIDKLTEIDLPDYLLTLPCEKRELASHIFSKNRAALAWKVIADEKEEGIKRLHRILKEHGIEL